MKGSYCFHYSQSSCLRRQSNVLLKVLYTCSTWYVPPLCQLKPRIEEDAVIVTYDTILTFPREIKSIWTKKFSIVTVLYLIERYVNFLQILLAWVKRPSIIAVRSYANSNYVSTIDSVLDIEVNTHKSRHMCVAQPTVYLAVRLITSYALFPRC